MRNVSIRFFLLLRAALLLICYISCDKVKITTKPRIVLIWKPAKQNVSTQESLTVVQKTQMKLLHSDALIEPVLDHPSSQAGKTKWFGQFVSSTAPATLPPKAATQP